MQYTQDYDESMPFVSWGYVSDTDNRGDWMDSVQPYAKSYQLFVCPSDTHMATDSTGPHAVNPQLNNRDTSYAVNASGTSDAMGTAWKTPMSSFVAGVLTNPDVVSLAAIGAPSTTVLAIDGNYFQHKGYLNVTTNFTVDSTTDPRTLGDPAETCCTPTLTIGRVYVERHLGTGNVLWADGHVKAMKFDNLLKRTDGSGGGNLLRATYFTRAADPD